MQYSIKLEEAYNKNNIDEFINIINEYKREKIHFNYSLIFSYVEKYIQDRKFDEVCKILKVLESEMNKYDIAKKICLFYFYAYNSKEAERIYFNKYCPINDKCLLVDIYLREGKIKQAREIINKVLQNKSYTNKKIYELKEKIDNYYKYNSFIETDYSSFSNSGKKLEKGHMIYLKHSPNRNNYGDYKSAIRPYLIWNIDGEKIYLYPLTTQCNKKDYIIFKKRYPNIDQDVTIKNNICTTTFDNVLSVYNKLSNEELEKLFKTIFNAIRYGQRSKVKENEAFIKFYGGQPKIGNVIEYINPVTREKIYYFVLDINSKEYRVVEVDLEKSLIKYDTVKNIRKDNIIFEIITLSEEQINIFLSQFSEKKESDDLSWKKVKVKGIKYIVIKEKNNICYCLNELYSPSYVQCIEINKDDIESVDEVVSKEEMVYIRKLLKQSDVNKGKKKVKIIY